MSTNDNANTNNRRRPLNSGGRKPNGRFTGGRGRGGRRNNTEEETKPVAAPVEAPREEEPKNPEPAREAPVKKEVPTPYTIPKEQEGKLLTGTVALLIQNRDKKLNFGFISLSTGEDFEDLKYPRVYYNPSCIKEKVYLRKGYQVQFISKNDEQGRSIANDIELTEVGRQSMKATEAALAEARKHQRQNRGGFRRQPQEDREEQPQEAEKPQSAPAAIPAAEPAVEEQQQERRPRRFVRGGRFRPHNNGEERAAAEESNNDEQQEGNNNYRRNYNNGGRGRGRGRFGGRGGRGRGRQSQDN